MKEAYLDYAATAPVKKEVLAAMLPYLQDKFGNPSSIHSWGQEARAAVDRSRRQVADFLNCNQSEIIFTSGGTEADNLAIIGIMRSFGASFALGHPSHPSPSLRSGHRRFAQDTPLASKFIPHIITSQIEHHAVLRTCQYLEKEKLATVTYLEPNAEGIIEIEKVRKAIKESTVLVSIMYINNEVGTIQPIREIGKILEKENHKRSAASGQRIYFHTDAVQAAGYQKMDVKYLHVDLLTLSGHKIGAPKGIGALFMKEKTPLGKIIFGGEQEMNFRSGTENVPGIVALGKAVQVLRNKKLEIRVKRAKMLSDYFIKRVLKEIPEVALNGSIELRSPNNANFYFRYIEGESILLNLDLAGIAASSGSACTSLSLEPSHVLMAIYGEPERAHGSVRFTLGEKTTTKEIDYTIRNLKLIVQKLRKISPLTKKEK